ncbi:putative fucosyltransferase 8 [Cardamine amara subsp. amara]|uniref:Fucosyltransferase n=1 Tax=Cardamine amara subsp. amara TaxID=228776 RepID=A0ABD1ALS4_CARAN
MRYRTMKSFRTFITCSFVLCFVLLLAFSNNFTCIRQPLDLDPPYLATNGSKNFQKPRDKLLGGLLDAEFDETSCLSRYQSSLYRKPSRYKPSRYLISKLRSYETLHKRCGPGTEAYKRSVKLLDQEELASSSDELCQYIVWVPLAGLGNRILSLVSVFLYALLTDRVMLVDQRNDISDLFCEPFPGTSWLLPLDFPLTNQLDRFHWHSPRSYGNMLKHHVINYSTTERFPSYFYLHLVYNYGAYDQMFFCEGDQSLIKKVPWLIVKSDNYFIPFLWLSFQTRLIKLFPQKETIFHHLARYLINPTNQVWGLVNRFYNAYLSRADERLGIQVRVFHRAKSLKLVMDQIVSCTQGEKLLPEAEAAQEESQVMMNVSKTPKLKAVLVTSLNPDYSNNLKSLYWEGLSSTGDVIGVYQPSQEMHQLRNNKLHNQKALAEMYLLSLTDNIVTSAWSTFGYVAQGLGGLKPWILYKPVNYTTPDPPCGRAMSMEPCFHSPPPFNVCGTETWKRIVPFVKPCEDRVSGVKLFDSPEDL